MEPALRRLLSFATCCLLAACERGGAPADSTGADAERRRGELLSLACQACHTLGEGQGHQIGPNLHGVFGRAAGTAEGFDYSPVLRAAAFVWTPVELDRWLADPTGFMPGTTMAFTGYRSVEDRAALITYLIEATGGLAP
jgi:cytochrome c